ncbi:MAG: hypothetical protein R3B57_06725 [Phycisphaerales bacterium]
MRLRLHIDDDADNPPAPIPFPRDRVAPGRQDDTRRARPDEDRPADRVEDALEDVQRNLDELGELLDSLPFPQFKDDDGPYAA